MRTRLAAGVLLVAVTLLDHAGAHSLAALVLVAAVPTAAGAALLSLGTALESGTATDRLQAWLGGVLLLLALAAAILRAPLAATDDVPSPAGSALTACLVALVLQALVGAVGARARIAGRLHLAPRGHEVALERR